MMKPSHCICRQMQLESDSAAVQQTRMVQDAKETKHQTTAYSDPSHLEVRACQVQKEDTATLRERH